MTPRDESSSEDFDALVRRVDPDRWLATRFVADPVARADLLTLYAFDHELAREFGFRCKQAGQLASKMRFLSAPWGGMLESGAWLRRAAHANAMAALLYDELSAIPGIEVLFPRQANSVFVELPLAMIEALRDRDWRFYTFIGEGGCRLMCAWDTRPEDVSAFVQDVRRLQAEGERLRAEG